MQRSIKVLFIILFLFLSLQANCKTLFLNVYLQRVIDGDTYLVLYHDLPIRVRAKDIDTFEIHKTKHLLKQEKETNLNEKEIFKRGLVATQFVKQFEHKFLCLEIDTKHYLDFYGRYLGVLYPVNCYQLDNTTKSINDMLREQHLTIEK